MQYKITIDAPKMVKLETCQAEPSSAENTTSSTSAAMASKAPTPWVMALAISSPVENDLDSTGAKNNNFQTENEWFPTTGDTFDSPVESHAGCIVLKVCEVTC